MGRQPACMMMRLSCAACHCLPLCTIACALCCGGCLICYRVCFVHEECSVRAAVMSSGVE